MCWSSPGQSSQGKGNSPVQAMLVVVQQAYLPCLGLSASQTGTGWEMLPELTGSRETYGSLGWWTGQSPVPLVVQVHAMSRRRHSLACPHQKHGFLLLCSMWVFLWLQNKKLALQVFFSYKTYIFSFSHLYQINLDFKTYLFLALSSVFIVQIWPHLIHISTLLYYTAFHQDKLISVNANMYLSLQPQKCAFLILV